MSRLPLMRKATALWLIRNTSLTFDQIANFCGLLSIEIHAISNDISSLQEINPVTSGELTQQEIERCSLDTGARLRIAIDALRDVESNMKSSKYISLSKRKGRPEAISWLLKTCPTLSIKQISSLLKVTKQTVISIQNGSHWNIRKLNPQSPVLSGICSQKDLDAELKIAPTVASK